MEDPETISVNPQTRAIYLLRVTLRKKKAKSRKDQHTDAVSPETTRNTYCWSSNSAIHLLTFIFNEWEWMTKASVDLCQVPLGPLDDGVLGFLTFLTEDTITALLHLSSFTEETIDSIKEVDVENYLEAQLALQTINALPLLQPIDVKGIYLCHTCDRSSPSDRCSRCGGPTIELSPDKWISENYPDDDPEDPLKLFYKDFPESLLEEDLPNDVLPNDVPETVDPSNEDSVSSDDSDDE